MIKRDVIVIGAGAAGLFCAAQAGARGRSVEVLDHAKKVGRKILMSGGGRCNFTNMYASSENFLSDNPHFCKSALAQYTPRDFIDLVEKQIGFPVVIKTLSGSQGSGVFLSKSKEEFDDLMQLIEAANPQANIILQQFVKSSHGRDLRVLTIGGRAVACMERNSQGKNFKANVSAGGTGKSFPITPEIEWLATQTANVLNLDVAGIDLLFDEQHFKICEANSSPGFEGLEGALGIDVAKEILHFIRIRLGIFDKPTKPEVQEKAAESAA